MLFDASAADGFLEKTMETKEEIVQNEPFLLLPTFSTLHNYWLSFKGSFQIFSGKSSKSSAADVLYVEKGKGILQKFLQ